MPSADARLDRRAFLGAAAGAVGGLVAACSGGSASSSRSTHTPASTSVPHGEIARSASGAAQTPSPGRIVWAADFRRATDSKSAGFGNVQTQRGGAGIRNNGRPIPVVAHPLLGAALKMSLAKGDERLEAEPGAGGDLGEGEEYYFRVDFALDADFPIDQTNPFCLINSIHHGSNSGSPAIEFDVDKGALWARGHSDGYKKRLVALERETPYKLVYRVVFSRTPAKSLLEVWVNDRKVLGGFHPPTATMYGPDDSYWKGATMYCDASIPPLTVYQNAHRMGTSYVAVA